jgi:hypothetical protein
MTSGRLYFHQWCRVGFFGGKTFVFLRVAASRPWLLFGVDRRRRCFLGNVGVLVA